MKFQVSLKSDKNMEYFTKFSVRRHKEKETFRPQICRVIPETSLVPSLLYLNEEEKLLLLRHFA
jgi:hypothetical protein